MDDFKPGDRVGIMGWGTLKHQVAAGPLTIIRRSNLEPNMWITKEHPESHIIFSDFFHWAEGLERGDLIPRGPSLREICRKKARHEAIQTALENITGLSASPGMGWADLIRAYSGNRVPKGAESAWAY
jgi:hypothetical protein